MLHHWKSTMLSGIKVLELTSGPSGAYAGRLFALSGATVKKMVQDSQSISAFRDYGKNLLYINIQESLEQLRNILTEYFDIVLWDSHLHDKLDRYLVKRHTENACFSAGIRIDLPGEVRKSEEYEFQAIGGWQELTGSPEGLPLSIGGSPACYITGTHAATAGILALVERNWTQHGGFIRIHALSVLVSCLEGEYSKYLATGVTGNRPGNRHHSMAPMAILPVADGWAFVGAPVDEQWELLQTWAGLPDHKKWQSSESRKLFCCDLEEQLSKWTRSRNRQELFLDGQTFRMPFGIVQRPEELKNCPQLKHRGFWFFSDGDSGYENIQLPWQIEANTAVENTSSFSAHSWKDLKILDLTSMWSGPYCTRLFADLGAEVIKIEAPHRPDGIRSNQGSASPFFRELNRNKRGMQLDLRLASDRDTLLQMVRDSDILVENFSPRVMRNFGLNHEIMWGYQPNLGIISLSAFGQTGPYQNFVGYGPTLEAMSGIASLTHYSDEKPWLPGFSVSDIGSGIHGGFTIAAVLFQKQQSGRGFRVDLSQYETACQFVGDYLLDQTITPKPKKAVKMNRITDLTKNYSLSQLPIPGGSPVMGPPWEKDDWVSPCYPPPDLRANKWSQD